MGVIGLFGVGLEGFMMLMGGLLVDEVVVVVVGLVVFFLLNIFLSLVVL